MCLSCRGRRSKLFGFSSLVSPRKRKKGGGGKGEESLYQRDGNNDNDDDEEEDIKGERKKELDGKERRTENIGTPVRIPIKRQYQTRHRARRHPILSDDPEPLAVGRDLARSDLHAAVQLLGQHDESIPVADDDLAFFFRNRGRDDFGVFKD